MLLKLLIREVLPLLLPQARLLLFELFRALRLELRPCGRETPFRVPVYFIACVIGSEGERVEGVVDAGCVQSGGFAGRVRVVELREVKAFGFLGRGLCVALLSGGEGLFFFC